MSLFIYHFLVFGKSCNHYINASILLFALADMEKQATFLSFIDFKSIYAINSSSYKASYKSFLLPNTKRGIPSKLGHEIS